MIRTVIILISFVFLTGFLLISTRYQARDLYVQIEGLRNKAQELDVQWRRLQLERAALTRNARIDEIARENLTMTPAGPDKTIYIATDKGEFKTNQGGQP